MAQIAFLFVHLSAFQKDLRCWQCSINPDFDSNRPKMGLESSALSCRQEELHQHDLWDFLLCEIFPIFRTLATWVRLSNRAEECSMPGKKKTYFFLSSCLPLIHLHTLLSNIPTVLIWARFWAIACPNPLFRFLGRERYANTPTRCPISKSRRKNATFAFYRFSGIYVYPSNVIPFQIELRIFDTFLRSLNL